MSRFTIAAMAVAWFGALVVLAVFTANGNSSKAPKGATEPPPVASTFTLNATTDIQTTGTCRWNTGSNGIPLVLSTNGIADRELDVEARCPTVINEFTASAYERWAPWTHRPVCTEANRTGSRGQIVKLRQYCVFTDATFRGGRGISVIAAPHAAAAMASALDDSGIPARLRDHPSTPLDGDVSLEHGPVEATKGRQNAFGVQDIQGRGKGVVAARRIRRGEIVFVDYVTVLSQNSFTANDGSGNNEWGDGSEFYGDAEQDQIMQLLQVAVLQLPETQQRRVHALAHSLGGERVRDILRTNVFGGITIAGASYIGLFPLGSRVNHHCQPNTYWRYTPGYMSQEVIAMRDIEPGEEVTHSYIPLGMVHDDRQAKMRDWGFNCSCSLCTATDAKRRLADQRRRRLLAIHTELAAFENGQDDPSSTTEMDRGAKRLGEAVDEMLFLIEKEQAWPLLCDYYPAVTRAYLAIDDTTGARKYWKESEAAWLQYGGEQHDFADELKVLAKDIEMREVQLRA